MKTKYLIDEADAITKKMDELWINFKQSDAYKDEKFRNYLMWIEHEVNKYVFHIKYELGAFGTKKKTS
jgi:hypothetical protein